MKLVVSYFFCLLVWFGFFLLLFSSLQISSQILALGNFCIVFFFQTLAYFQLLLLKVSSDFKSTRLNFFLFFYSGRYITFIMDPFQYVYVIRNSKQLEFHEFADKMASKTFDYPALSKGKFPDLKENLHRIYQYLQGKPLDIISDHMMKNLQDIFEWKCSQATDWETEKMYKFCCSVMFEASFVTLYGRVPAADGHKVISEIRDKFIKFDASFPYLAANIPIELLGATKKVRKELIHHFLLQNMTKWLGGSKVVQARQDIFEKYELLGDYDKAGRKLMNDCLSKIK